MSTGLVTLFACGDVMPGRGVDQILPHPGDPELREAYIGDATSYVRLAERANGPIPRPASFSWPWGDALPVLERGGTGCPGHQPGDQRHPQRRLRARQGRALPDEPGQPALPGRGPAGRLRAGQQPRAGLRPRGLRETLDSLAGAGLRRPEPGSTRPRPGSRRPSGCPAAAASLVFSCGAASSGIPPDWAATATRPGVDFLPSLSPATADALIARTRAARRPGDVVVVSIHWGSNWGYGVPDDQVRFARRLIDGGVDLIHGHSSHHPRPVEVYRGRLVLYGCGDCIDDYEGISGYEKYRDDLRLLYFASVAPGTGMLAALRMVPMQARNMRLCHASAADADGWRPRSGDQPRLRIPDRTPARRHAHPAPVKRADLPRSRHSR